MMKLTKAEKEMIAKLQSGKLSMIAEVLKEFRTGGSIVLLPYLFDIISSGNYSLLEEEILNLVSDIKEKGAAEIIADSLQKNNYKNKTAAIIATCWQSRLDFSPHLLLFTEYFFSDDYQVSIEAFTVIEESLHQTTVAQRNACLKLLEDKRPQVTEMLKPLYQELFKLVKNSLGFTIDN
ncbi:MAG: hypothetical protein JXB00_03520 [Bacteroidales bacterium]|nr:hypothetical protein [Bacteroidales bacterium]